MAEQRTRDTQPGDESAAPESGSHETGSREPGAADSSRPEFGRNKLGPHPDIAAVVASVTERGARQLLLREAGVRAGDDAEDVHQARVATRRLRADLRSLRPVLDTRWTDRVRDDLRWLGALLGEVRDLDVLAIHLSEELDDYSDQDQDTGERILEVMADQRRLRLLELVDAMSSSRYDQLIDDLVEATSRPPLARGIDGSWPARKVLRKASATAWRRTERAAARLDHDAPLSELHELRKRAKRARYVAELSAPVFGKPAKRLARRLREVQDRLGELNDAVTLLAWLDREAPHRLDPAAAYLAGRIAEHQRRTIESERVDWWSTWSKIRRSDLDWLS